MRTTPKILLVLGLLLVAVYFAWELSLAGLWYLTMAPYFALIWWAGWKHWTSPWWALGYLLIPSFIVSSLMVRGYLGPIAGILGSGVVWVACSFAASRNVLTRYNWMVVMILGGAAWIATREMASFWKTLEFMYWGRTFLFVFPHGDVALWPLITGAAILPWLVQAKVEDPKEVLEREVEDLLEDVPEDFFEKD